MTEAHRTKENRSLLAARVDWLVERHGSLRAAARVVGVNYAYLHRLRTGEKTEPTAAVLRKLGLRRVVTYEPLRKPQVKPMRADLAAIYHGDIDGDLEGYDGA